MTGSLKRTPPFRTRLSHCWVQPLSECGLHAHQTPDYPQDFWWVCTEPERPMDTAAMIDWRCAWCIAKTEVELKTYGDHPQQDLAPNGTVYGGQWLMSDRIEGAKRHLKGLCDHV